MMPMTWPVGNIGFLAYRKISKPLNSFSTQVAQRWSHQKIIENANCGDRMHAMGNGYRPTPTFWREVVRLAANNGRMGDHGRSGDCTFDIDVVAQFRALTRPHTAP